MARKPRRWVVWVIIVISAPICAGFLFGLLQTLWELPTEDFPPVGRVFKLGLSVSLVWFAVAFSMFLNQTRRLASESISADEGAACEASRARWKVQTLYAWLVALGCILGLSLSVWKGW